MYNNSDTIFPRNAETQPTTILRMQNFMKAFTKAERKVAETVLSQLENTIYYSVTDLSEQAGVGETTVLRFCRKIGFKGYQEFKLALAKELVHPVKSLHQEVTEADDPIVIAQKVTATNIQAIQATLGTLDPKQLERAVDLLTEANRIHFYGAGTSGVTAIDAKYKFLRIGLPIDTYTDAHVQAMAATTLKKGDVAVGISVSGSTKDTVDSLTLAKESGAAVICITHYARSPITKIANVVLLTAAKESPLQGGALSSKIAQLHVVDILHTAIAMRIRDKALHYKEKTAKAVLNKIY